MRVCVLLVTLCALTAGEDTVPLKEIDVTLPKAVGDVQYKGRKDFDQKGLGYSVGYGSKMCAITLFVYDLGMKEIPAGKANPAVEDQLKASIKDVKTAEESGFLKNVQPMKGDLPLPKAVLSTFATAGFTFDVEGGACKSYILLVGRSNHFIKIRVTQYVVDGKSNDAEVNAFFTTLVKVLTPPSP